MKREIAILTQTVRETVLDHGKDLAAAIAFWAFFSIFPLLIGVFSLTGYFVESDQVQIRISEAVTNMLPGSADFVRSNLEAVVRYRGTMTWIGVLGLLWSAGKGFGAVTRAVNRAIGAERTHSFLLSKLRYFLMAVAVSVMLVASIAITVAIEVLLEPQILSKFGLEPMEVPRLRGWAMSFVLVFMIFSLIYKMAPYVETAWRQVIPGAMLATVLFELLKAVFLVYIDRFAHLEAVYGSLSSIIVLLLWLYVSALILVFGAEYNIVRSQVGEPAHENHDSSRTSPDSHETGQERE